MSLVNFFASMLDKTDSNGQPVFRALQEQNDMNNFIEQCLLNSKRNICIFTDNVHAFHGMLSQETDKIDVDWNKTELLNGSQLIIEPYVGGCLRGCCADMLFLDKDGNPSMTWVMQILVPLFGVNHTRIFLFDRVSQKFQEFV